MQAGSSSQNRLNLGAAAEADGSGLEGGEIVAKEDLKRLCLQ